MATTSLRLNVMLFFTLVLALLSISTSYWAFSRLVQEERQKIGYHFSRLMTNIRAHEDFLTGVTRKGDEATEQLDKEVIPLQFRLLANHSDIHTYEGRSFSFATPFTLNISKDDDREENVQGVFSIGVLLTNFYNSFWSASSLPSPQSFVFDLNTDYSLAIPALGFFPDRYLPQNEHDRPFVQSLHQQLLALKMDKNQQHIRWAARKGPRGKTDDDNQLLGFIAFNPASKFWLKDRHTDQLVAVTILELNQISKIVGEKVFDRLDLIPPGGKPLLGSMSEPDQLNNGLNFFFDGLIIKLSSDDAKNEGWTALYHISYERFIQYAKWQLLVLISLLLASILGGLLTYRWYLQKVILPARNAYRDICESDSFGRIIIQNVPVAICILRQSDSDVLLVNQTARQMLGDAEAIGRWWAEWNIPAATYDESSTCIVVSIDDRFLQLSYIATHYEGEDVLLCAFNDLTEHKQAEKALAEAKQLADAASEAKMRFLATMTHEIRTPLYGMLGTLELLALTRLSDQQDEYLQTIQQSSASLLQLLSDILDVSKIEAGQMILEQTRFCPLDIIENILKQFSETAIAKKLQFYACIDPNVPGLLYGDAGRIRQILVNLVSNAIKFTDVGRVVIRLRVVNRESNQIDLEWQVTDTGIGIPVSQQSKLFEPFYQAHAQNHTVSGTGLGLAISRQLIRLMKGELRMVSDAGLGSSFIMALRLTTISDTLPSTEIALPNETVYVRGPTKELVTNACAWFKSWGAKAITDEHPGGIEDTQFENVNVETTVLIDLFPEALTKIEWKGPHLLCSPNHTHEPQLTPEGWLVNLYAIRMIGKVAMTACGLEVGLDPDRSKHWAHKFNLHVLVAEDNPINQTLLKEQLEELGCQVTLCSNGQEVLQRWHDNEFDVLLTDVNMPLMNGYELVLNLRERNIATPIIGITANAIREEGERCIRAGMNAWLTKPVTLRVLADTLYRVTDVRPDLEIEDDNTENETELPLEQGATAQDQELPLQIPERMRNLFIKTMRQDIQTTRQALIDRDANKARLMFHRMRGALAMVYSVSLAESCEKIEEQLLNHTLAKERLIAAENVLNEIDQAIDKL